MNAWRKACCCLAAAGFAGGAWAANYSDDYIETDDSKVIVHEMDGFRAYEFKTTGKTYTFTVKTDCPVYDCLLVGGGGGGGRSPGSTVGQAGGGGGGGGVIYTNFCAALDKALTYSVTVGGGGTTSTGVGTRGGPGGNTTLAFGTTSLVALGGGGAGTRDTAPLATGDYGSAGGAGNSSARGAYTVTQGNVGGRMGGGGGGATQPGFDGNDRVYKGKGGDGLALWITGARHVYGSGGGSGIAGSRGGEESGGTGGAGVAGLGGGGGVVSGGNGAGGGSGCLIVRFVTGSTPMFVAKLAKTRFFESGAEFEPAVEVRDGLTSVVLTPGDDYAVTYSDNVSAGAGLATVSGRGKYAGFVQKLSFTIEKGYNDGWIVTDDTNVEVFDNGSSVSYLFTDVSGARSCSILEGAILYDVLVVGGGGGGGRGSVDFGGGGGGGGGVISRVFNEGQPAIGDLAVQIGDGGAGAGSAGVRGTPGTASVLAVGATDLTAFGGSGGASPNVPAPETTGDYGSAGGAVGGNSTRGAYTVGQGSYGGAGPSGGGGGATQPGENGTASVGGTGGSGLASYITGVRHVYGSGGGGGSTTGGAGGEESGGVGNQGAGAATLGGGGGGGIKKTNDALSSGGRGGSGCVILRLRKSAASIVACDAALSASADGAAHAPEVLEEYPQGLEKKWSLTGETGTFVLDEAPTFDGEGVHRVWCRLTKDGFDPLIVESTITIAGQDIDNQTIWYVKPDGDPSGSGLDWASATTLENACRLVKEGTAQKYSQIVLEAGEVGAPRAYSCAAMTADANGSFFSLAKSYVTIRSAAADRDARRVVITGGGAANRGRFLQTSGPLKVEGLTFRDFHADGLGGVLDNACAEGLEVRQCAFENNRSEVSGGAIAFHGVGSARACSFIGNSCAGATTSLGGAAVCGNGANGTYGAAVVEDSLFVSNAGTWSVSYATVKKSDFIQNQGGVFFGVNASDCTIMSNRYVNAPLSVVVNTSLGTTDPSRTVMSPTRNFSNHPASKLERCSLFRNEPPESAPGQGVYIGACTDCTFVDDLLGANGVGHMGSGALTRCVVTGYKEGSFACNPTCDDCVFTNNATALVIQSSGEAAKLTRCIFAGNHVSQGALLPLGASAYTTIDSCLFTDNSCGTYLFSDANHIHLTVKASTIVDNVCGTAASGHDDTNTKYPASFQSSIIARNTPCDLRMEAGAVYTNCLYSTMVGTVGVTNGSIVVAGSAIRFAAADAAHPYGCCPTRRNPAVDRGIDFGYTADSKDLANTNRVYAFGAGGRPDIGCYEYIPPKGGGLIIFVR